MFLYCLWAKNGFYTFKWLEKIKNTLWHGKNCIKLKFQCPKCNQKKDMFICVLSVAAFCTKTTVLRSETGTVRPTKATIFTFLSFTEKVYWSLIYNYLKWSYLFAYVLSSFSHTQNKAQWGQRSRLFCSPTVAQHLEKILEQNKGSINIWWIN